MFTGIIENLGRLERIEKKKAEVHFTIKSKRSLRLKLGDSLACNGACLTVMKKGGKNFTVELMPETLRLTNFKDAQVGDYINLEQAVRLGERLNGHFVSGHVDGVGTVKEILKEGKYVCLSIKNPGNLRKYLAKKGSVAVNGVSLTIADRCRDSFKVCLISYTLEKTNLSFLRKGSEVNLEVDLFARYLESLNEN